MEVDFEEVEVKSKKGGVTVLLLEDGTKLKIQHIIVKVVRLNQYTPLGEPLYQVISQNVVSANVPKELRREPTLDLKKKPNEKLYG